MTGILKVDQWKDSGDNALISSNGSGALTFNASSITGVATVNGITDADEWRLTTDYAPGSSGTQYITSNWERNDNRFNKIGNGMTQSSGVFSFPNTGIYLIQCLIGFNNNQNANYIGGFVQVTSDNSTYVTAGQGFSNINYTNFGGSMNTTVYFNFMFNVSSTSTHKCKMATSSNSGNYNVLGSSVANLTSMTFIRLGDS